jgi:hypothetical protein
MRYFAFLFFPLFISNNLLGQGTFEDARTQAIADAQKEFKCTPNTQRNIYESKDGTIHIFVFEDGNLLVAGYPTTATEKNKYQVHLYRRTGNDNIYLLEYAGVYSPAFNIQNENAVTNAAVAIERMDFAILGPFTNNLQLTVKSRPNKPGTSFNILSTTTIQIAKTIHASIGTGLIYTNLKNPSNIKQVPLPSSNDSTLIADDIHGKGLITLLATFYPWGRNTLMMPSNRFKDRFGVILGTAIAASSSNFRDIFFGGQYDFSIGGSIVGGVHYGRRQKISNLDYKDFKFGETKFAGNLNDRTYMDWDFGFFFGVQVDNRIFSQLFPGNK